LRLAALSPAPNVQYLCHFVLNNILRFAQKMTNERRRAAVAGALLVTIGGVIVLLSSRDGHVNGVTGANSRVQEQISADLPFSP
jgi:hypothetical protein